ncbi:hypothetical protein MPNT_220018 [Candidatus Methylacidithermus pantelleriae]|uniref:Uncharacterized protein n=1 Tax=Candidatus Methylacidithermus pantelleriae TaxID=2744239 RepID=A0A8J2BLU9_9BACT|nr:hypothetical protein MPNT_220018 [Candidatus Methylacidithermus pantelleriae]
MRLSYRFVQERKGEPVCERGGRGAVSLVTHRIAGAVGIDANEDDLGLGEVGALW